jgi:hypothetical protein
LRLFCTLIWLDLNRRENSDGFAGRRFPRG